MHSATFIFLWCSVLAILYYFGSNTDTDAVFDTNERLARFNYLYNYNASKKVGAPILIYAATTYFGERITTEKFLSSCDSSEVFCRITDDTGELSIADAVLFHNWDYSPSSLPSTRNSAIPYLIFDQEAPNQENPKFQMKPAADVINWTMTYRRDADIWFPYGHFERLDKPVPVDFNAIWDMKEQNKTAVWMASNCNAFNRREKVINKLKQLGLKTDIFGDCGEYTSECDNMSSDQWDCVIQFLKQYKFYMAFENSNCVDYVTEKFFYSLQDRYTVPIVMKRRHYEDIGAPPGSFVAVDDFSSLKYMADYLNKVAENRQLYLKYHEWRRNYIIIGSRDDTSGPCLLCRKLQKQASIPRKSYKSLKDWHAQGMCDNDFALQYLD